MKIPVNGGIIRILFVPILCSYHLLSLQVGELLVFPLIRISVILAPEQSLEKSQLGEYSDLIDEGTEAQGESEIYSVIQLAGDRIELLICGLAYYQTSKAGVLNLQPMTRFQGVCELGQEKHFLQLFFIIQLLYGGNTTFSEGSIGFPRLIHDTQKS